MKKINWENVCFIGIIIVIFLFSHAVSFGFGRAYERKTYKPSLTQCMKFWPAICEPSYTKKGGR